MVKYMVQWSIAIQISMLWKIELPSCEYIILNHLRYVIKFDNHFRILAVKRKALNCGLLRTFLNFTDCSTFKLNHYLVQLPLNRSTSHINLRAFASSRNYQFTFWEQRKLLFTRSAPLNVSRWNKFPSFIKLWQSNMAVDFPNKLCASSECAKDYPLLNVWINIVYFINISLVGAHWWSHH